MKKLLSILIFSNFLLTATEYQQKVEDAIMLFPAENEIEELIIHDQEWIDGAKWGFPRSGHPEGGIIFHIQEVLSNVDTIKGTSEERRKLRLIAIIHDTFKYKVDISKPLVGVNDHAYLARQFAEKYIDDSDVLEIIELHDEAYYAWKLGEKSGNWEEAENKARQLMERLGNSVKLYVDFYYCDNATGDKTPTPYQWFKNFSSK